MSEAIFDLDNLVELAQKMILIELPDKDFWALCSTSKKFYNYCTQLPNSEYIYHQRSLYWISPNVIAFKENLTWREFYTRIMHFSWKQHAPLNQYLSYYAINNRLMELKIIFTYNNLRYFEKITVANIAAAYVHRDILTWLKSLGSDILPTAEGANQVVVRGDLEMLKWLERDLRILPDSRGANSAAANGNLEILRWLTERSILPDYRGANAAAENGYLEILRWLSKGIGEGRLSIIPNQRGVNKAAENGHLKVLKWSATLQLPLSKPLFPDRETVDRLKKSKGKNQKAIVEWLK